MKRTFHNSRAQVHHLEDLILSDVVGFHAAFEVSDVKQDGTVFVKFRSHHERAASEMTRRFCKALRDTGRQWQQTADNMVRLALDQFRSVV